MLNEFIIKTGYRIKMAGSILRDGIPNHPPETAETLISNILSTIDINFPLEKSIQLRKGRSIIVSNGKEEFEISTPEASNSQITISDYRNRNAINRILIFEGNMLTRATMTKGYERKRLKFTSSQQFKFLEEVARAKFDRLTI